MSVFFVFSILYALKYADSVSAKKYAVMKIVGAKPGFLALNTYLEVMMTTLIGMGIGIGCEIAFYDSISWVGLDKFTWIAYLLIILVTAVTVFIPTTIRVFTRIKRPAIDKKNL